MKRIILILIIFLSFSCKDDENNPVAPSSLMFEDGITAFHQWDQFEQFLGNENISYSFTNVSADSLDVKGRANTWFINFYTPDEKIYYMIKRTKETIEVINASTESDGNAFFTEMSMDSKKAIELAEENGGKEFRDKNSDYYIKAILSKAVMPGAKTSWNVYYKAGANYLTVSIDVLTAEILNIYSNS